MFFTKMNGLGNDFIVIEDFSDSYKNCSEIAKKLCDRHFGIGADGILMVKKSDIADAKMLIYNSDGSQAEMCGNGIRCFAKYLYDMQLVNKNPVLIETLDGLKEITLEASGSDMMARVNMGRPNLEAIMVPVYIGKDRVINEPFKVGDSIYNITSMLIGVPHTVIFVDDYDIPRCKTIGEEIEKNECFTRGTNVNFVKILNRNEFMVRTWERGAGLTLACGTGTCASLAACVLNGRTERVATASLPGGTMIVEWDKSGDIFMTGPCETVFTGEYVK